uniref:Putative kunitz-type peptidase inhibitor n=1 Tax=Amblyomma americanum TaxID=6943 RepID=A0A0C9SDY4_AMBAM
MVVCATMSILNTIAASYSLVALLLVVSQCDPGAVATSKDVRCGHGRPNLTQEEINGDVTFRFFNHNKSCVHFMVTATERRGFEKLHECVTKCETGQGADPKCAGPIMKKCQEGDEDCLEVYFYNATTKTCVQFESPFEGDFEISNTFMHQSTCEEYCMGFTEEDLAEVGKEKS